MSVSVDVHDSFEANAIVKVCLQLGTIVLSTVPLSLEDGSVVHHRIPLEIMEELRLAIKAMKIEAFDDFEKTWKAYASKSQDEHVRNSEDLGMAIANEALFSGFGEVAWANAGLENDEVICMVRLLLKANDSLWTKYYPSQCQSVEKMIDLLDSLGERFVRNESATALLYRYFEANKTEIMLLPVYSRDHAVYMVIFPALTSTHPFTVAVCDGGGGEDYHETVLHTTETDIAIRGHCVFDCSYEDVQYFLKEVGNNWESRILHSHLSGHIKEKYHIHDIHALVNGEDPSFRGQCLFVNDQLVGNCAMHNLLQALKFFVTDSFNLKDNRFYNSISLFDYSIFDTAMCVLRAHRDQIVNAFNELQFRQVERMVSVNLCKCYETINPNYGCQEERLEPLVDDIFVRHESNIIDQKHFEETYLKPRREAALQASMMRCLNG